MHMTTVFQAGHADSRTEQQFIFFKNAYVSEVEIYVS